MLTRPRLHPGRTARGCRRCASSSCRTPSRPPTASRSATGSATLSPQTAAETLTTQVKARSGLSSMDATNVYEKVFAARAPVLRWPGDANDRTVSSMQNGLAKYAPGLNMTVRNTATHEAADEMTAQQALERLAALSLLAHWIDECEGPIPTED
ncbi:TIGR02391 family protein [Streptomyces xantholiticus]